MVEEWAIYAALTGLHGLEYEVWSRLFYRAEKIGENRWRILLGYTALAEQCGGCSEKTIQRAVRQLRQKGWLSTSGRTSRLAVTQFTLSIPANLQVPSGPTQRRALDSFSTANREAFFLMKNTLSRETLAAIEDEARLWLIAHGKYNTTTHLDKIDELIMRKTLGPDRVRECEEYFTYLYE